MSHADKVRDAKEAVVERAVEWECQMHGMTWKFRECSTALAVAVSKLRAIRAATCQKCGGTGEVASDTGGEYPGTAPCPAGCKEGAKP